MSLRQIPLNGVIIRPQTQVGRTGERSKAPCLRPIGTQSKSLERKKMAWPSGTITYKAAQKIFAYVSFEEIVVGEKVVGYKAYWLGEVFENPSLTALCQQLADIGGASARRLREREAQTTPRNLSEAAIRNHHPTPVSNRERNTDRYQFDFSDGTLFACDASCLSDAISQARQSEQWTGDPVRIWAPNPDNPRDRDERVPLCGSALSEWL